MNLFSEFLFLKNSDKGKWGLRVNFVHLQQWSNYEENWGDGCCISPMTY